MNEKHINSIKNFGKWLLYILLFFFNLIVAYFSQIVLNVCYETGNKSSNQKIIQFITEFFVYTYGFLLFIADFVLKILNAKDNYIDSDVAFISLMIMNVLLITFLQIKIFQILKKKSNNHKIQ